MIIVNYITLLIKMQERNSVGWAPAPPSKTKIPKINLRILVSGGGWEIRTPAPGFPRLTI